MAAPVSMDKEWSSGCCGCFEDIPSCLIVGCLGACITYGQNVNQLKATGFCGPCMTYCCLAYCLGCPCFIASGTRTEIRQKYGLKEGPMNDCLIHFPCCSCCAVCQEFREIKKHGGNP